VSGSLLSVGSSAITLVLGVARSIMMARFLFPEAVGVSALALVYYNLAAELSRIGIHNAFIHHKDADEKVRATYFTLNAVLTAASMILLAVAAPFLGRFHSDMTGLAAVINAYLLVGFIRIFNSTQMGMLTKDLSFKKIAIVDIASSICMGVVGPWMAWQGYGVWAIVGEMAAGVISRALFLFWGGVHWRPRFGWDRESVRWFYDYGIKVWWASNFTYLLDRFDDFWIGTVLGKSPLGYYSKAYEYAGYPRRVVSTPLLDVFYPTFARLQDDRLGLSRAFFRVTSLMVRFGCWFSLIFVLTAPEFVPLLLGAQWLPMVGAFQLMIIYTLLSPLSEAASNLLLAVGQPAAVLRIRWVQLLLFIPAVILLASAGGIEGVALAADGMILIGTALSFAATRRVVDYSLRAMWGWPMIALVLAGGATLALGPFWDTLHPWLSLLAKSAVISLIYGAVLLLFERRQLLTGWKMVVGLIRPERENVKT